MKQTVVFFGALSLMLALTNCASSSDEEKLSTTNGTKLSCPLGQLGVVVKSKSDFVMQGTEYSAEIYLTQDIVNNCTTLEVAPENGAKGKIERQKDRIAYNVLAENPGLQSFSGNVIVTGENGKKDTLPFVSEYMVAKQKAAIMTKYLVKGIENPLAVSVSGVPPNKLKVETSEGKLTGGAGGSFMLNPSKTGECLITVKAEINGQLTVVDAYTFEVIEKK